MRLPPEPVLIAAKRWLEVLPTSGGVPRAQALFATHRKYGDLSPTHYSTALVWLRNMGFQDVPGSGAPPANQILGALFESAAPMWFQDADDLVRSPDELPSDIVSTGQALGVDSGTVYEQLVSSWGKVDTALRERVGAAGEAELVQLLRNDSIGRVDHVSTWSDGYGYDISFNQGIYTAHLEVKSTTRVGRFTAYLSRHEYEVMLRDPHWVLVAVRLTPGLKVERVGSVPKGWITANVPRDSTSAAKWSSCKLEVPLTAIKHHVSQLGPEAAGALPSWHAE